MSSTTSQISYEPRPFDRTIADLKQGLESAKTAQAEVPGKAMQTAKGVAAFNRDSLAAYVQASRIFSMGSQDLFRQAAESTRSAFTGAFTGAFRRLGPCPRAAASPVPASTWRRARRRR